MKETDFHQLSNAMLSLISDALEEADANGQLEFELEFGVMTITLPDRKTLIISKHTASRQLWLSSPISGGLHFSCNDDGVWILSDGVTLTEQLMHELDTLAGVKVAL